VFAVETAAGFAPGSLWLSMTEVTAGETLKIFTVVYDSSTSPIEGDVVFNVDAKEVGTQHFKLAAGETQILSSAWTATAGSHTFEAKLKNISGASDIASMQTNSTNISVAAAPPSPIVQITNTATNLFASTSPTVQNIANTIFDTTEDWRQAGSDFLSKALYADIAHTPEVDTFAAAENGEVLGTSTLKAAASSTVQKGGILGSIKRWILTTLLYIFNIRWLFYLSLLAVLYILFKIVQGFFRYRRGY
jgi:hypothetical protein